LEKAPIVKNLIIKREQEMIADRAKEDEVIQTDDMEGVNEYFETLQIDEPLKKTETGK
jgi:hypothetical protein